MRNRAKFMSFTDTTVLNVCRPRQKERLLPTQQNWLAAKPHHILVQFQDPRSRRFQQKWLLKIFEMLDPQTQNFSKQHRTKSEGNSPEMKEDEVDSYIASVFQGCLGLGTCFQADDLIPTTPDRRDA